MTNKYDIYDSAKPCSTAEANEAFQFFIQSFIEKDRRERWTHFLLNNPSKAYKHSAKLEQHLDKRCCTEIKTHELQVNKSVQGIYFDFSDPPISATLIDSCILGDYSDGLFISSTDKLAIYFSHEGRAWVCST